MMRIEWVNIKSFLGLCEFVQIIPINLICVPAIGKLLMLANLLLSRRSSQRNVKEVLPVDLFKEAMALEQPKFVIVVITGRYQTNL